MSEDPNHQDYAAWQLLAEFSLPVDSDTPDRVVARVAAAMAELHLPEARLRQVREIVVDALVNHIGQRAVLIRLFIALPAGLTRDHTLPLPGWGLFSIQKALGPLDPFDVLRLVVEIYFYT